MSRSAPSAAGALSNASELLNGTALTFIAAKNMVQRRPGVLGLCCSAPRHRPRKDSRSIAKEIVEVDEYPLDPTLGATSIRVAVSQIGGNSWAFPSNS